MVASNCVHRPCTTVAKCLSNVIFNSNAGPSRIPAVSRSIQHGGRSSHLLPFQKACFSSGYNSGSGKKKHAYKPSDILLKPDQLGVEPTLEYLDSLKPNPTENRRYIKKGNIEYPPSLLVGKPHRNTLESEESKQWKKTKEVLNASFTRAQLIDLAKEAQLPGNYGTIVRKPELVKQIMIHRFGMVDIDKRNETLRKEESEKFNELIKFEPFELFLLLAKQANMLRQQATRRQVNLLPQKPPGEKTKDPRDFGLWIRGNPDDLLQMRLWSDDFKKQVKVRIESLHFTNNQPLSELNVPEFINFVSRQSHCLVKLHESSDNDLVNLTLYHLDPSDADRAMSMLNQFQSESNKAKQRIGSASYVDDIGSLRQYSMFPFVSTETLPWPHLAQDIINGSQSDLAFRTMLVSEQDVLGLSPTTAPSLSHESKTIAWNTEGVPIDFTEPFLHLMGKAETTFTQSSDPLSSSNVSTESRQCSATFGHLVFGGGLMSISPDASPEQMINIIDDPLAPPRPGIWPFQHLIDWVQQHRSRIGKDAAQFIPTTIFKAQKSPMLLNWFTRENWVPQNTVMQELMLVSYQQEKTTLSSEPTLEILIAKNDHGWKLSQAVWNVSSEADMMFPEKSVDVRLEARIQTHIDPASLPTCIHEYIDNQLNQESKSLNLVSTDENNNNTTTTTTNSVIFPPLKMKIHNDSEMIFQSSRRILRQVWHNQPQPQHIETDSFNQQQQQQDDNNNELISSPNLILHREISYDHCSTPSNSREQIKVIWQPQQVSSSESKDNTFSSSSQPIITFPPSWKTVSETLETFFNRFHVGLNPSNR